MNLNSGVTVIATQCKLYPADINFLWQKCRHVFGSLSGPWWPWNTLPS